MLKVLKISTAVGMDERAWRRGVSEMLTVVPVARAGRV